MRLHPMPIISVTSQTRVTSARGEAIIKQLRWTTVKRYNLKPVEITIYPNTIGVGPSRGVSAVTVR